MGFLLLQLGFAIFALCMLRPEIALPGSEPRPQTTYISVPVRDSPSPTRAAARRRSSPPRARLPLSPSGGATRLMMEMRYMLSHGAAESSVRLLRKYGLLDILLPFQAAYLSDQIKGKTSDRDLMLMKLLANLDKLLSADRPCHCSLCNVAGFIHVTDVDIQRKKLTYIAFAPCPGDLPSRLLIASSLTWYEA